MNKKETPLSKTTLSFRTTNEEDALYKAQAEKLGMSYAQYLAMMIRRAHEGMFEGSSKREQEIKEGLEEEQVIRTTERIPMSNEELIRTLGKLSTTNLDFLVSNHLETQKRKNEEQLEKAKIEVAEQTAKETEERVRKEIEDKNIVIAASPELKEVFDLFVKHYTEVGRIKNPYELIQRYFKWQSNWGYEPDMDSELFEKAMSKEYLNEHSE